MSADLMIKDDDGEPLYKVRHSDKLAETLLKGTDKRFSDAAVARSPGTGTTYNIQINQRGPTATNNVRVREGDAPDAADEGGYPPESLIFDSVDKATRGLD